MGGLFSKKRSRITKQDQAILQLKSQRDRLNRYRDRISRNVDKETAVARTLLRQGLRDKAMLILRKKRFLLSLVEKTGDQLDAVERIIHDVEFAQIEMDVLESLRVGNVCLKSLNDAIRLEDVEKILEDTKEAADYQQEVTNILSGVLEPEDEAAAEAELNGLLKTVMEYPEIPFEEFQAEENISQRVKQPLTVTQ
ncbi:charged multivesicular body protein 6 [Trichuris trichiura]|uniref:Charged multivesicular body protein 6 n=1 Tax=Trichuris trichiura TaxID=36087 RepID=A0A077YZ47_TRITR|nr:charged multivesicular body protein 6 [Trichuris trichiura]